MTISPVQKGIAFIAVKGHYFIIKETVNYFYREENHEKNKQPFDCIVDADNDCLRADTFVTLSRRF